MLLVAEYFHGQDTEHAQGEIPIGDPAMTIAVPAGQFREDYLVHAPTNYEANYANVVAPDGTEVTLDGQPVDGWSAVGGSKWRVARVALDNTGDGNHRLQSAGEPISVQIYGYGQYTSYIYPGGMNLEEIEVVLQ